MNWYQDWLYWMMGFGRGSGYMVINESTGDTSIWNGFLPMITGDYENF